MTKNKLHEEDFIGATIEGFIYPCGVRTAVYLLTNGKRVPHPFELGKTWQELREENGLSTIKD